MSSFKFLLIIENLICLRIYFRSEWRGWPDANKIFTWQFHLDFLLINLEHSTIALNEISEFRPEGGSTDVLKHLGSLLVQPYRIAKLWNANSRKADLRLKMSRIKCVRFIAVCGLVATMTVFPATSSRYSPGKKGPCTLLQLDTNNFKSRRCDHNAVPHTLV